LRGEASVSETEQDNPIIGILNEVGNVGRQRIWKVSFDVHASNIFGVGSSEPGIVNKEVCVNKIEIHVIDEGSGVSEVRVMFLDINIFLPEHNEVLRTGHSCISVESSCILSIQT